MSADGSALPPPSGPALPGPDEPAAVHQPRVVVGGRGGAAAGGPDGTGSGAPANKVGAGRRPGRRRPTPRVLAVGALALLVTGVVITQTARKRDDRGATTTVATTAPVPASTTVAVTVTLPPSGVDSSTSIGPASSAAAGSTLAATTTHQATPAPDATATSATATTAPATTAPATTVPATTAPATTASAPAAPVEPSTTETAPEPPADGRVVAITSRVEACGFGPRCLIAGFTLQGFATQPTTFTCIFSNGARSEFTFRTRTVKRACTTGRIPDSITIEVAGVRSTSVSISR